MLAHLKSPTTIIKALFSTYTTGSNPTLVSYNASLVKIDGDAYEKPGTNREVQRQRC
jgi:hypothetical protein